MIDDIELAKEKENACSGNYMILMCRDQQENPEKILSSKRRSQDIIPYIGVKREEVDPNLLP